MSMNATSFLAQTTHNVSTRWDHTNAFVKRDIQSQEIYASVSCDGLIAVDQPTKWPDVKFLLKNIDYAKFIN